MTTYISRVCVCLLIVLSHVNIILSQTSCPSGFTYYVGTKSCYKYIDTINTLLNHITTCSDAGEYIVTVNNALENARWRISQWMDLDMFE